MAIQKKMIHTYGRQWARPENECNFDTQLIKADELAMTGKTNKAINQYNKLANHSKVARRRLQLIKKQILFSMHSNLDRNIKSVFVSYIDWYQGFNTQNNIVNELFEICGIETIQTTLEDADLVIAGCYGDQILERSNLMYDKLVMFISGENLNPCYEIHDFSFTTQPNTYCGKNIRLPQWIGELKEGNGYHYLDGIQDIPLNHDRDIMFSSIYNNSTPQREEVISYLRLKFGHENVQVYGSMRGSGEIKKFEILARSRINICFENSIGEGYITEKLLHSAVLGCNSLYWGDYYYKNDFITDNVFNLYEERNFDKMEEWCRRSLNKSNIKPIKRINDLSILLRNRPDLNNLANHLRNWVNLILLSRL